MKQCVIIKVSNSKQERKSHKSEPYSHIYFYESQLVHLYEDNSVAAAKNCGRELSNFFFHKGFSSVSYAKGDHKGSRVVLSSNRKSNSSVRGCYSDNSGSFHSKRFQS